MTMLPERGQYQPKYVPLTVMLVVATVAYGALFYVEEMLSERDYSAIPRAETRFAYCMVTSMSPYEKHEFARSVSRPDAPDLYAVVLAASLAGEATEQKQGAIRALRERNELRQRAWQIVNRLADKCRDDPTAWRASASPMAVMERWLQYDEGFRFFAAREKQASPDAAERLYRVARKGGWQAAKMPVVNREHPGAVKCVAC